MYILYELGKHSEIITALMISTRAPKWENGQHSFLSKSEFGGRTFDVILLDMADMPPIM